MSAESGLVSWTEIRPGEVDPAIFRQGYPMRVVTDLNELCNIQCDYCHIAALWGPEAKNARTLSPGIVRRLLQDADAMQAFDITYTGGEVTTMRNFNDYLDGVNELSFSSVQIITNGTRLTKGLASEIKDAGVRRVSISVDGPQASHDAARGEGTWRRAWRGLENAVEAGLTVNVISVLGLHNLRDWHQLVPELKNAGVRSQNISLMCRLGRAETAEEWQGVPEECLPEVRRTMREIEEEVCGDGFEAYLNDGVMHEPGWSGKATPLHAFQDQNPGIEAVVKVDGSVMGNRLYGKGRAIGNVMTRPLVEIWEDNQTERKRLEGVVGTNNIGSLPTLYYHYEGEESGAAQTTPRGTGSSSDVRTREEPWGTVSFDPNTFTITDIKVKESVFNG